MNLSNSKFNVKAQFWMLLGPLFIGCILFISSMKATVEPWTLPVIAIFGLLLCYKWHWKGVFLGITFLLTALIFHFNVHSFENWLWTSIQALSIASAFALTTLCFEESNYTWGVLNHEIQEQKNIITSFNQRLQEAQNTSDRELQTLFTQIEQLDKALTQSHQTIAARDERLRIADSLLSIVRDELTTTHSHHEKLLSELQTARHQAASYAQHFEAQKGEEEPMISLATHESEMNLRNQEIQDLKSSMESLVSREIQLCQQLQTNQNELLLLKRQQNETEAHFLSLSEDKVKLQDMNDLLSEQLSVMKNELITNQADHAQLAQMCEHTLQQKNSIEQEHLAMKIRMDELYQQSVHFQMLQDQWHEDVKQLEYLRSVQTELQVLMGEQVDQQSLCSQLQDEKEILQQSLENLKNEYERLINAPVTSTVQNTDHIREIRRLEGLYQQLREQFNEKSTVLTETRRELFHTQEMLAALHKESEEAKFNNEIENEYYIGKLLSSAEDELTIIEQKDREIEHLHDLITVSLNKG